MYTLRINNLIDVHEAAQNVGQSRSRLQTQQRAGRCPLLFITLYLYLSAHAVRDSPRIVRNVDVDGGDVDVVTVRSHHYVRISATKQNPFTLEHLPDSQRLPTVRRVFLFICCA